MPPSRGPSGSSSSSWMPWLNKLKTLKCPSKFWTSWSCCKEVTTLLNLLNESLLKSTQTQCKLKQPMQTERTLPQKPGLEYLQWAELLKKASNSGRSQRGPLLKGCWTQPWIQLKNPTPPTNNNNNNNNKQTKETKERKRRDFRTHSTPSFSQSCATASNWDCKFLTVSSSSASTSSSTSMDSDSPPSSTSWKAARVLKFGKSRLLLKIPTGKAGKIAVESKLPELLSSSLSKMRSGNSCRVKWLWITLQGSFESPNPLSRNSPETSSEPAGAKATCQPETVQEFFWKICTGRFLNWNFKPPRSTTLQESFLKRKRRAPMKSKQ